MADQPILLSPPAQIPDELIEKLKSFVSSNDLPNFRSVLHTYLASEPSRHVDLADLTDVLAEAFPEDKVEFVSELLQAGVPTNFLLALEAIQAKSKNTLEAFLQHGWDINHPLATTKPTVLGYSTKDEEMALWLIDHGADVNKQTYIDLTPMSYAVAEATPDLVRKMLELGGDVHKGELLHHAIDRSSGDAIEVLELLLDKGACINALMYEKHENSLRMFPFMGLGTPLHTAAEAGKLDVVRFLIEKGADTEIKDSKGRTARECAERMGHPDVMNVL